MDLATVSFIIAVECAIIAGAALLTWKVRPVFVAYKDPFFRIATFFLILCAQHVVMGALIANT